MTNKTLSLVGKDEEPRQGTHADMLTLSSVLSLIPALDFVYKTSLILITDSFMIKCWGLRALD